MKYSIYAFLLGVFVAGMAPAEIAADADHRTLSETTEARDARMKWWRDAKLGMFIHWGLYSGLAGEWKGAPGGSEWIQKNVEVDTERYAEEALPLFQPKEGSAKEWAQLAQDAGCQYAVMTSKHHDGFGLWDSKLTSYDSKDTKGRDLVGEYLNAFRAKGMKVGLYHSVIDWHHPSYDNTICPDLCYPKGQEQMLKDKGVARNHADYQQYLHGQVRELLSQYGKLDVVWWDYSQGDASGAKGWKAPELIEMCLKLQPHIIMNNRLYSYSGLDKTATVSLDLRCGDFTTPEQHIPEFGYPGIDWESCMTVGDKWGYNRYDKKIKPAEELIQKLVECTTKGGNLLLNINPMADGSVPPAVAESLRGLGKWLKVNGEAIYGTRPLVVEGLPKGMSATQSDKAKYIFILNPEKIGEISLPALAKNASFVGDSDKILKLVDGKLVLTKELLLDKVVPVVKFYE